MRESIHQLNLRLAKFANALAMSVCFAFVWFHFLEASMEVPYSLWGNMAIIGIFLVLYCQFGRIYEAFLVSYMRISELVYSQMLAVAATDVIMYVFTCLLLRRFPPVYHFLFLGLDELVIAVLWSYAAHLWYFKSFPPKRTIVVWDMRKGMENLVSSYGMSKKFNVLADYSAETCVRDLSVLDDAEVVFLSGVHSHDRNIIIKYCIERGIVSFMVPRVGDVLMSGAQRMHLFHLPILRLAAYNPAPEFLFLKRLTDIVFSVFALVLTLPLQLLTMLAIKLEDGGPVFYKQVRLTQYGRRFELIKFRSMSVDAEKDGVARLSSGTADSRITRVGAFIRATRIDEIPQFVNVLKGEMSIVGPRPERPEIAEIYEKELPEFRLRLQAKCGLTGYAQVYGKYNTEPYDKLQMDLMYIANPGIAQDINILFATIKILFLKDSTEGIDEEKTNAL